MGIRNGLLTTVTLKASTEMALTMEEVKDHLRIERGFTADDALLTSLRQTAEAHAQNILGQRLIYQVVNTYYKSWPNTDHFILPISPVITTTSSTTITGASSGAPVSYKQSDRTWATFASTEWFLDTISDTPKLYLEYDESWPTDSLHNVNPIKITYRVGYSQTSTGIPAPIKTAMKLSIGSWYENREQVVLQSGLHTPVEVPRGARDMLEQYRMRL